MTITMTTTMTITSGFWQLSTSSSATGQIQSRISALEDLRDSLATALTQVHRAGAALWVDTNGGGSLQAAFMATEEREKLLSRSEAILQAAAQAAADASSDVVDALVNLNDATATLRRLHRAPSAVDIQEKMANSKALASSPEAATGLNRSKREWMRVWMRVWTSVWVN